MASNGRNHMNTTHSRVRYNGAPISTNLPAADADVSAMKLNDARQMRAKIHEAIEGGTVPDAQMLAYLNLQERLAERIGVCEAREAYLQTAPAPSVASEFAGNAPGAAPAYVRSVGDGLPSLRQKFSITRAILAAHEGRPIVGAEAEVIAEGRKQNPHARGQVVLPSFMFPSLERRNIYGNTVTGDVTAGVTGKPTASAPFLTAIHGVPTLQSLGARVIDVDAAATFLVPFLGRTAAGSSAEAASASSSATFSELSLTPTRYTRRADVSALALRTNGSALDAVLLADFEAAHAWALDAAGVAAIRSNATFTFATETGTDDLAATTLANVFDLATDTMNAVRSSVAPDLFCSPIGYETLQTVVATNLNQTLAAAYTAGSGARVVCSVAMADGDIPAEKALASVASGREFVGAGLVVAGDFSNLILARFGGPADLVIDPYTDADNAVVRIVANSYTAAGIVRDAFRCLAVTAATITDTAA